MNTGKNIPFYKIFIIMTIVAIFCNACVFIISGRPVFYFYFMLFPLFIYYVASKREKIIKSLIFLYNNTPFKYYALFAGWLLLSAFILVCLNKANIIIFYYIIVKLFPTFLLCYLLSAFFIPKYISIKLAIKIFTSITFGIFVLAMVGFIGDLYNIPILSFPVDMISNIKRLHEGVESMTELVSGLPRARGVFHEPGGLGRFITICIPIIYQIGLSKYHIYKNKYVNFIVKKSLIPLAWASLICTFSPVSLLFVIIITAIYFAKSIIKYGKKNIIPIVATVFVTFVIILLILIFNGQYFINLLSQSFISRILNVVINISNIETMAQIDGSMGSRLVGWTNAFILFLKRPIIGYGYDYSRFYMYDQLLRSPVPLVTETIQNMIRAVTYKVGVWYPSSLLIQLLVETGIIGTVLYLIFLFKNITFSKNMMKYFGGIEADFLKGMTGSIWIIIGTIFYTYCMALSFVCFIYGLFCSYAIEAKNRAIMNRKD